MIEIISNPDKKIWGNFVYNHPHGNIFQTPEMAEVFKETKNYLPLTLAAIDSQSDEILAMVNAVRIHDFGTLLRPFTSRSIISGGPLYYDNPKGRDSFKLLMEHYDTIVGKSSLYTEIRNLWDTSNSSFPDDYIYEEHLNFLIDLSLGRENLWKNLSDSPKRGINRSKKKGVTIQEISSENELETFYYLLKDTYKRVNVPLADKSLFEAVYKHLLPKNMGKFFFAHYKNTSIGASVILLYKERVYTWYRGALEDYSKFYPHAHLLWHAMEWGSMNNYLICDFMGAGKPDEKFGIREFKRQFGGSLVNYGRYKKIHSPIKYWIAQRGLGTYKKIGKYFAKL
jgi:serine/alanine adding enzyme